MPVTLLTGAPGVGKTTVIVKLAERLRDRPVGGFFTREVRVAGERMGFEVESFDGTRGMLAHVRHGGPVRVGHYGVNVGEFERVALPAISAPAELYLVDEIGKMECASGRFVERMRKLLGSGARVIATVAAQGAGFIEEVKKLKSAELIEVTLRNRDGLPERLASSLL